MNRELGFFTCYGIEYVYDYLGEERINKKIEEFKDKPTMGTSLEDFTYGNPEYSYYGGKGVLHIFGNLIHQWFDDNDVLIFLLKSSTKYNIENYFEEGLLKRKWQEYLGSMDMMILSSPKNKDSWENNKLNPYWMEYHFFYSWVFKKMITEEMIDNYLKNFIEISLRVKKDVHSLNPGQVLSNGCMWAINGYYESKSDNKKANEIAKLNNLYDVWREMPIDEEED